MSSSNLVEVNLIEETVYGETPATGDFKTLRFTSEGLSGSAETTESQQLRSDRMSSGQVVTSVDVKGDAAFELAKEDVLDLMLKSAMQSEWTLSTEITEDLDIDVTAKTLTRGAGDFTTQVRVGDMLKLSGFVADANNTEVMVAKIESATEITFVGPKSMEDETGSGTKFQVADYLEIGVDKKSFSMQKTFKDLSEKAINYRGMVVSDLSIAATYGSIATGSVTLQGNDYDPVDEADKFMTDGRTVEGAATTQSMNGSVDMPLVAVSELGVIQEGGFCMKSIDLKLGNNLSKTTCIGRIAAKDFSLGTAKVEVSIEAYLGNSCWSMIRKKLTQEEFAIGFQLKNGDGWYAFYMPAIQVSFDDPSSGGQNQDVMLSMSGGAKVGPNGDSSLRIYRS